MKYKLIKDTSTQNIEYLFGTRSCARFWAPSIPHRAKILQHVCAIVSHSVITKWITANRGECLITGGKSVGFFSKDRWIWCLYCFKLSWLINFHSLSNLHVTFEGKIARDSIKWNKCIYIVHVLDINIRTYKISLKSEPVVVVGGRG